MRIMAMESSSGPASVIISDDGTPVAWQFQNNGYTHSRTLLPMAEALLKTTGMELGSVDYFAVAAGPGSFTGIRIGVATVKGLAFAADKPCVAVSTLEGMAYNISAAFEGVLLCPVMDARRNQVYNALFYAENGSPRRLCADRAVGAAELADELIERTEPIWLCGDGAADFYKTFSQKIKQLHLAPPNLCPQNAYGVACAAEKAIAAGRAKPCGELIPVYLRKSQAERERENKITFGGSQ